MRTLVATYYIGIKPGTTTTSKTADQIEDCYQYEFYPNHFKSTEDLTIHNVSVKDHTITFEHDVVDELTIIRLVVFKSL